MRILLVGPPGSGKGTQAKLLQERLGLAHIGMGDLLRQAVADQTAAGQLAHGYMQRGQLVPDAVVNQMVAEYLRRADRPRRFVMDGYPRNRAQAEAFDRLLAELALPLDGAVELLVDDEALVARLSGRRICPKCNAVYHMTNNPPKSDELCDQDASPLLLRDDDREQTIRHRLAVYRQTNQELLDYYRRQGKLKSISADQSIDEVHRDIVQCLQPA